MSIGQLEEEGLWPSKCGEEAPRNKSSIDKSHRLAKLIARNLNPLHISEETADITDPEVAEKLKYTKGKCYCLYHKLVASLAKIRARRTEKFFTASAISHKAKVLRAKETEDGWKELLDAPVSSEILYPRPQPVVPCEIDDLDPLLEWLSQNVVPPKQTAFTKGTIVPDGRLDLCKQVIGPKGIDPLLHSMTNNEQVKRLLLGNNIVGDDGAKSIAHAIETNAVPNMDTWYIAGNNISAVGIKPICEALYDSKNVKALW
eukprot:CAMPEP_0206181914 /NCGR_PEP_ID=MMETSP1474-20131121/69090_1 /ASSEMBLY_ACC=CAM_ASM_001110 /TAXON_ID=97495 /ORGANISM="Imantonia sp., Strain RCC918" /LENGTH=258 /DNA_ID=CAMNT_0053596271 /DNA_START=1999 /DNA_END=2772 /DNA_ORIENTATION=+